MEVEVKGSLYTTSPNSGTLKSYNEVVKKIDGRTLKEIVSDPDTYHKIFNEQTLIGDNGSFVILGSDSYYPKDMKERGNYMRYFIKDENDNVVYKELYLYFIGYKDRNPDSPLFEKYRIPSQVVTFLNLLPLQKKYWENVRDNEPFVEVQLDSIPGNGVVHLSLKNNK